MQIGSTMGVSASFSTATQSGTARIANEVNAQTAEAAANAAGAMFGLAQAVGGASEAIMNIAAGEMSSAVDIQV